MLSHDAINRAERFLTADAKLLPTRAPGLMMVEMAAAPGAFRSWEAIIRRRFQPAMHTRVGGVVLFSAGLSSHRPGNGQSSKCKGHPQPARKNLSPRVDWKGNRCGA